MTDAETLTELKQTALQYFEARLCVFPLTGYRKHPIFDWTPWKTELPSKEQMEQWFSDSNLTGIALLCGSLSGIGVVDDDNYKSGNPLPISSIVEVMTASGGRHLYFGHNSRVMNTNRFAVGYQGEVRNQDVIIVLPPSKVKNKQGKIGEYRWLTGGIENFTQLQVLTPEMLVPLLAGQFNQRPTLQELVKTAEGARHDNFVLLCHNILKRFNSEEWETSAIPYIRFEASRFEPQLPDSEVERVIQDCIKNRTELGLTKTNSYSNEADLTNDFPLGDRQSNKVVTVDFKPVLLSDITEDKLEAEWIWEGYVAEGVITLMTARPKTGKTTLISQMLREIETGGELAGMSINPANVLILTEESEAKWGERREKFKLPGKSIYIVSRPMNKKYTNTEWVAALAKAVEICEENEIKLCVIDTLTTFWDAQDENDAAKVSRSLLPIMQLAKKNIGVLIVHHDRKSGGDYGNAARGSNALTGFVDIIVELGRLDDAQSPTRRVLKTLSRFDESPSEVVIDLVDGKYVTLGDKTEVNKQQKLDTLVNCLALMGKGVTISEIFDSWDEDDFDKKPSRSTLQRHLAELIKLNRISVIGETVVKKKKTPIYGLNSTQHQKSDIDV